MKAVKALVIPVVIGLILIVLGLVLGLVVFPVLLDTEVEENVVLEEDTLQWYRFKDIPFPINFKVHFFTIQNPTEVTFSGATPIVTEVGPYVWSETRSKLIKSIDRDSVEYGELWSFKFNAKDSAPYTEDDILTVLNAPLLAVLQNLEDLPIALPVSVETLMSDILTDTRLFIPVRVKDYAFNGITMCDPARSTTGYSKLICLSIMLMRKKLIEYHEDQSMTFSLFGYKLKEDGPMTMKRGIRDLDQLGSITSYKGQKYTQFWAGDKTECDLVEGHYTTFPPFMEPDTSWRVYSTDICKGGILNYAGESTFKDIKGYRFQAEKGTFGPAGQECACIKATKNINGDFTCFDGGVLDLNSCLGVPVILSFPHLMWADSQYQETIEGLDNSYQDGHNSMLDFQPELGFPLTGAIRIQFNLVLRPMGYGGKEIEWTSKYPRALFPLLWVEDSFELTDTLLEELDSKLISKLLLMDILMWVLVGVGALLVVVGIAVGIACNVRKSK